MINVIILAAGKGTRLKSEAPKVLHPLFGKPLLERVFLSLSELSMNTAYLIVGHGREQVMAAVSGFQLPFPCEPVTQEVQQGTGHAVLQVKKAFHADLSGKTVVILSGDAPLLRPSTLAQLVQSHQQGQADLTLLLADLDQPTGYGRVVTGADNQVLKIVEERDATATEKQIKTVNAGIYCAQWDTIAPLLDSLTTSNAQGELYLTDVIELAVSQGHRVKGVWVETPEEILGVNSRADLALCHQVLNRRTQEALMAGGVTIIDPQQTTIAPEVNISADTVVYPGCFFQGEISVGNGCALGPHTTLMGQIRIGENSTVLHSVVKDSAIGSNTTVGPFAHLRDGTHLADHVRIGNFVEVKNTQIDHHSNAAHLAYLGDATLGSEVNMGAGSITANYDPIRQQKHRTEIEDGVKVGCNSVLVAPVTIGHHSSVAAGSVITRDVAPWDLAIARSRQAELPQWVAKVQKSTSPTV